METICDGIYSFCPCESCDSSSITPECDSFYLNGVSTLDLLLISRHILGLQLLDSPYKIIAADADRNNTVTSFDVVELRKLILGIYKDSLPNNKSWRFVDKAFVFSDPINNPFADHFPEFIKIPNDSVFTNLDFIGIKVGDVNNTALPCPINYDKSRKNQAPFSIAFNGQRDGQTVTFPIIYQGDIPLEAFQLGIRFDPAHLRLIAPSRGDLSGYGQDNFGLTRVDQGEIRTLWWCNPADACRPIQPGDVLFHLTFEMLELPADGAKLSWGITLDDTLLPNLAWTVTDEEQLAVQQGESQVRSREEITKKESGFSGVCLPNPTGSGANIRLQAEEAGKGYIALFGPFGGTLGMQAVQWQAGVQLINIPVLAGQPAGVYRWAIFGGGKSTQGHVIKH